MITDEKTADKWLDGLDEVLKRVQEKQQAKEVKYSIETDGPYSYVKADRQVFTSSNIDTRKVQLENYLNSIIDYTGRLEIPTMDGEVIAITDASTGRTNSVGKLSSYNEHVNKETGEVNAKKIRLKQNIALHIDEVIAVSQKAEGIGTVTDRNFKHDAASQKGWTYRNAYFEDFDGKKYAFLISVPENDTGKFVYNVNKFRERNFETKRPSSEKITGISLSGAQTEESLDSYYAQNKESVKGKFSLDTNSGNLQAELYELKNQRKEMLEADEAYRKASEQRRYANTFAERVAASRALREAQEKIDTAEIDRKISELQDRISKMREEEVRKHREEKEKYAGTKTAGYSMEPDTRLKSLDAPYMEAVKSGNKSKAQKLVQQAAEAAMPKSVVRDSKGKLLKTYHYTNSNFTAFDRSTARTGNEMDGFFFAPDAESTREYGERQIVAYLNITNLAVDPVLDRKFDDSGTLLREKLAAQGYDGVARTENGKIYEYMVFDPEQIKLADAVTYDDAGNAIPLSERFNMGKKDIRYALDTDHYDYSRSFAQQIDDYVAGKFPRNDTFVLGKTPDIFQKVGLSALPLTMDQVHVDYALNGTKDADHLMGADLLKELPSLLEKPVAIIESATHPGNSVVAIVKGEVNGNQLMAAVRVGGGGIQNGATIDSNHVASSHGKGNAITKLLLDALKKENAGETGVYYINKTEAQDLCARSGVQFPGSAAQDGLIHSIFDAGSPVNRKYMEQTETRQFKRWFGDSKVVDKKGAPRKLYHYTDGEFTVFDTNKSGSNQGMRLGDGIYLSTSPTEFSSYGKNRMELYASILNPFEMQLTDEQANAVLDKYASAKHDLNAYDGVYRNHAFAKLTNPVRVMDYLQEYAKDNGIKVSDILKDLGYDGVHDGMEWVAFEPGQVKSATDNIGTFDRNNPDIRYSLDTEQLEKTVRAIDTKALEEGLQSMTLTSNVNSFTMKDPSRFFDAISKNNTELRDELHDIFEKPHSEATGKYARGIKDMQERVRNIATEAGILSKDGKKFDKAASAAVQNIGEGIAPIACSVEAKVVEADTIFLKATRNDSEILSGNCTLEAQFFEIWKRLVERQSNIKPLTRERLLLEYRRIL